MNKKKKIWIIVIFTLLLIAAGYALFFRPSFYKFNGGEAYITPVLSTRYTSDFRTLTVINNSIYECNSNGLVKKDKKGAAIWSKAYYIETPLLVTGGNYIAVADITGKNVYIFNESGYIRTIEESNELISVDINENGFLTTVMESDKRNIINYYNNDGKLVITRATSYFEDGYPVTVASSMDVTKMITGYINVNNNRLQSTVSFFGFEDRYDKFSELLIGGFTYEDMLINEVKWIDNNTAIAVFDKQVVVFDCKNEPKVINKIELTSEIRQIGISKNTFQILYGKSIANSQKDLSNSVCLYNIKGEFLEQYSVDGTIRKITSNQEGFYIITDSKIIKYIGKKREWFASTYLSIGNFYEIGNDEFLVTTEQGYDILKMREE